MASHISILQFCDWFQQQQKLLRWNLQLKRGKKWHTTEHNLWHDCFCVCLELFVCLFAMPISIEILNIEFWIRCNASFYSAFGIHSGSISMKTWLFALFFPHCVFVAFDFHSVLEYLNVGQFFFGVRINLPTITNDSKWMKYMVEMDAAEQHEMHRYNRCINA